MKSKRIKIIFVGTPEFGLPAMGNLIKDPYFEMVAVITQPDKLVGRKKILTSPPVKVKAEELKLPVLQPDKIITARGDIAELKPDIIVVAAYAQIIPEEILNIPPYGCINIHASLLPKYRGASVVQAAILSGDKETGVTIMKMDKHLDTGPVIAQAGLVIGKSETAAALSRRLSLLGAELLLPTLKKYIAGELEPVAQNNAKASYVKTLKKEDGRINWLLSAEKIERFVRAMTSWPGAFTKIKSKNLFLKITEVSPSLLELQGYRPGEIFSYKNNLAVQCGQNAIEVKRLQLEGKKEMAAQNFMRGHADILGSVLE